MFFRSWKPRVPNNTTLHFLQSSKLEWLLGCRAEDMSNLKALEVLGISSAMLEEEKARILGSLGVKCWGNAGNSSLMAENSRDNAGPCIFRKRSCAESEAPSVPVPMSGMAAPTPAQVRGVSFWLPMVKRTKKMYLQSAATRRKRARNTCQSPRFSRMDGLQSTSACNSHRQSARTSTFDMRCEQQHHDYRFRHGKPHQESATECSLFFPWGPRSRTTPDLRLTQPV